MSLLLPINLTSLLLPINSCYFQKVTVSKLNLNNCVCVYCPYLSYELPDVLTQMWADRGQHDGLGLNEPQCLCVLYVPFLWAARCAHTDVGRWGTAWQSGSQWTSVSVCIVRTFPMSCQMCSHRCGQMGDSMTVWVSMNLSVCVHCTYLSYELPDVLTQMWADGGQHDGLGLNEPQCLCALYVPFLWAARCAHTDVGRWGTAWRSGSQWTSVSVCIVRTFPMSCQMCSHRCGQMRDSMTVCVYCTYLSYELPDVLTQMWADGG